MTAKDVMQKVCDIIQTWMSLADDQVYLYDQKFDIPPDNRMYIAVGALTPKAFGNSREQVDVLGALNEKLTINMGMTLKIDVFSKTTEALERKEEILMALNSTISQQSQQANSFYIAQLPTSFVDLSVVEGAAIPYRFNMSLNVQYFITKLLPIEYYDNFRTTDVLTNE